ncbi:MAG: hypothetical protein ABJ327_22290 [Litoreibacter sp.]
MIEASFLLGMAFCAAAFLLIKADDGRMMDKFGAAAASFITWCAFGMLLMAGTYGMGLLIPGAAAAGVLISRQLNLAKRLTPFANYKLPLSVAALLASITAWIGVLNLMEEIPHA